MLVMSHNGATIFVQDVEVLQKSVNVISENIQNKIDKLNLRMDISRKEIDAGYSH